MSTSTFVPAVPDGARGARSVAPAGQWVGLACQIKATTDEEAIDAYLRSREFARRTLEAYQREAARFLGWCRLAGKGLRDLSLEDLRDYLDFLKAPPAELTSARKFGRADPRWRVFSGPMGGQTAYYAIRFVKHLLAWLASAQYLPFDPAAALRLRRPRPPKEVTRYLPREGIDLLIETTDRMPADTAEQRLRRARARFVVILLYRTALRLSEAVEASMGDVQQDYSGAWWVLVRGKGRIEEDAPDRVPIAGGFVVELSRYRLAFGMSALPDALDGDPLIARIEGRGRVTKRIVAHIVESACEDAAVIAQERGNEILARALRAATPHWLRHSYLSHLVAGGADLRRVADIARHRSIATTGGYTHAEAAALQQLVRDFA